MGGKKPSQIEFGGHCCVPAHLLPRLLFSVSFGIIYTVSEAFQVGLTRNGKAWWVATLLLLAPPIAAQAQDFTWTTNADETITITGYTGSGRMADIPSNIMDKIVTRIGTNAFHSCTSLTGISIPKSVTNIGRYAFYNCASLTNAVIPESVNNIDGWLYTSCENLVWVTIPNSVTNIGTQAFMHCESLTNVVIPDSVKSIGGTAFMYCDSLLSVSIGSGLKSTGSQPFGNCTNLNEILVSDDNSIYSSTNGVLFNKSQTTLIQCPGGKTGSYTVPESVTNIEIYAFLWCAGVTRVTIPASVTSIGRSAILYCSNLTEIAVNEGNPIYGSTNGVLFNKSQTTLIQCPGGKIGSYTVPNSVTSIGERGFEYCTSLTRVTIPNSVTNIGEYAFTRCAGLVGIYFKGNAPSLFDTRVFYDTSNSTNYYLSGTIGWPLVPDPWPEGNYGRPTALWLPAATDDGSFGVQAEKFGFNIDWTDGQTVVVEANTDMNTTNWVPVATNILDSTPFYFGDPEWTNYPGRFYRIRRSP